MVPQMGFEPMTNGLRVRDSDLTELLGYNWGLLRDQPREYGCGENARLVSRIVPESSLTKW